MHLQNNKDTKKPNKSGAKMGFVTISAESHTGNKRPDNQDYYDFYIPDDNTIHKKGILMTVADGMGGHLGGEIASSMAINILMSEYYKDKSNDTTQALTNAFLKANSAVYDKNKDENLSGMGTTLTAVVLIGNEIYHAHVGDTRGYIISNGEISQFTEDHSYVASLVKAGVITAKEAKTHPERNKITRALGVGENVVVDVSKESIRVFKENFLLICTDGLHGVVSNEEILNAVSNYKEPSAACSRLIEMANEHGGPDNVTVLIARIDGNIEPKESGLMRKLKNVFK